MNTDTDKSQHWTTCALCRGQGTVTREPSRKKQYQHQEMVRRYEASGGKSVAPAPLMHIVDTCPSCAGSGICGCEQVVSPDYEKYPQVAIIGGGIGGAALAVACLHRGIPFTLYERDTSFNARSQGYGLTLQQASKAIEGLGIFALEGGVISTRHAVHDPAGKVIGEWGLRRWKRVFIENTARRRNVHIARQTLRQLLLQNAENSQSLKWGHALTGLSHNDHGTIDLTFRVGDTKETAQADLVVGADGIRSVVRGLVIKEESAPLRYLDCFVMLGICPLSALSSSSSLLDSATVFQTVNGHERIYMMPYDKDTIMWQLSFPLAEVEAKQLSAKGAAAMKDEAQRRLSVWHDPIPHILAATPTTSITGYPVYDRPLFDSALLANAGGVTLLGDAAHPMSPFKGQGANQALLDALTLARTITKVCDANPSWREAGIRQVVLNDFEKEMARRSASKVEGSAQAAKLLHSPAVLHEGDEPRGQRLQMEG